MRDRSIKPTSVERVMREDDFIVSMTDPKGRITYANRIFIEFSGYTERELLGAAHNIIRHPDMPRGVFQFLWDTLHAGQECFAYVKNMARDGSFYWVFANVTPNLDAQGNVTGYFSVRRKPRRAAVEAMADVYAAMLAEERRADYREQPAASLAWLTGVLAQKATTYDRLVLSL